MFLRRPSIVLLTVAAAFTGNHQADAGCCDWLFGRRPAYVVGAPAVVAQPVTQPACPQPVITQRVAVPAAAYAVPQPVTAPLATGGTAPIAVTNGAYQAQRPAYNQNPSVYSGMPVIMAPGPTQASFRVPVTTTAVPQVVPTVSAYRPVLQAYQQANPVVPITRAYRGIAPAATSNPIYGTGNVYPDNYQVRYQAASPAVTTTAPACPTPGCPTPVVPATPVVVAAPPKRCCLSRFFGSCFGQPQYQTTYYRAPITYYRPVTSVNPVTGTTVTVQQPCTSTVQQIQRSPYIAPFTQSAPTMTVPPATGSNCGSCTAPAPSTYLGPAMTTTPPQTYGGVGQAGGVTSPSDRSAMPIPSIEPQPGYTPNTQPLQGAPPTNGGDLRQVPQPRLESARPTIQEQPQPQPQSQREEGDSYWGSRDHEEKTALNSLQTSGGAGSTPRRYNELRPIEAPSGYRSPYVQRSIQAPASKSPSSVPVRGQDLQAPPLLPLPSKNFDLRDTNSASVRVSVPVREATLMTRSTAVSPVQRVRDSGGWQAND